MKKLLSFILLTSIWIPSALGQCTAGVDVGGGNCIPPHAPGMPGYQGNANQPQQPRAVWADRWGAVAFSESPSLLGVSVGKATKSEAEKEALADCHREDGANCKPYISYRNQCVAISSGNKHSSYGRGSSLEVAKSLANQSCRKSDSCEIVYSDCSFPERIQ